MRLPLIDPFETARADFMYEELYNHNKLVVNNKFNSITLLGV